MLAEIGFQERFLLTTLLRCLCRASAYVTQSGDLDLSEKDLTSRLLVKGTVRCLGKEIEMREKRAFGLKTNWTFDLLISSFSLHCL